MNGRKEKRGEGSVYRNIGWGERETDRQTERERERGESVGRVRWNEDSGS